MMTEYQRMQYLVFRLELLLKYKDDNTFTEMIFDDIQYALEGSI